MHNIKEILEYIATTSLLGVVPLDIIMHFILGALIFMLFLKVSKSITLAFSGILLLALLKEAFDWEIMMRNKLYFEPVKDIIITLIGACVALLPLKKYSSKSRFPYLSWREK